MGSGYGLQQAMEDSGMSISRLSRMTGLSRSTIRKMRSGYLAGSLYSWKAVSDALGVRLDALLEDDDERDLRQG